MAKPKKKSRKSTKKSASKRSAKKRSEGRKRPKRGFKLSPATKRKIGMRSKAHWKKITGNGTPKSHIPLKQLEKNHARLSRTIAERKKSPAKWA